MKGTGGNPDLQIIAVREPTKTVVIFWGTYVVWISGELILCLMTLSMSVQLAQCALLILMLFSGVRDMKSGVN